MQVGFVGIAGIKQLPDAITYDITVDTAHEMVANGIISHNCMGRFHPHADTGIVGAMVTLANSAEPLINGEGNWGDHTDGAGAMRYIECRLTEYAEKYLLDKDYLHPSVTDMVSNYDGEEMEPVLLPAKLPNLLINGSYGIAMGVSSYIPSFTIESVTKLVRIALNGKPITPKLCLKYLQFNFKYGGDCISTAAEILDYYSIGKASLKFQASHKHSDKLFMITALPPMIKVETMLENYRKLPEVMRAEETTDKDGISFSVKLKKSTDEAKLKLKLLSPITVTLSFQTYLTERFLDKNNEVEVKFKKTSVPEIFNDWVMWRIGLERRVIAHLIIKSETELEKLTLLQLAAMNIPIMKATMDVSDPIVMLIKKLRLNGSKLTEEQANFLISLTFKQLTKASVKELIAKIKTVKAYVLELKADLKDPSARILKSL